MTTTPAPMPRLLVPFLNLGHALTHLIMLIFPTAVLALGPQWNLSYDRLVPASLGGLIAYGAGSLPAGWLGDRWSRRTLMALFFLGTGAGAMLAGLARTPWEIGGALAVAGLFAAIYHPVGLSLLVADPARLGRTLGLNGVFGNLGIAGATKYGPSARPVASKAAICAAASGRKMRGSGTRSIRWPIHSCARAATAKTAETMPPIPAGLASRPARWYSATFGRAMVVALKTSESQTMNSSRAAAR